MKIRKKQRIFIGTCEIAGCCRGLLKGLKELGADCFFCEMIPHKFSYTKLSTDHLVIKLCRFFWKKRAESSNTEDRWKYIHELCKAIIFVWALFRFDIFIYPQDTWFWDVKELKILKKFRKKVIVVCLGSPSRATFADGSDCVIGDVRGMLSTEELIRTTKVKLQRVRIIEAYADYYINLPAQAQLNKKPFISLCNIGLPVSIEKIKVQATKKKKNGVVKIVHAPSKPRVKGTKKFREIIERLKDRYEIDYVELINMPHHKVLEELMSCDFVLDQLYTDTPLSGLGAEGAWIGKPTIDCGFFADRVKEYYSEEMLPPSLYVLPEDAEGAIVRMIEDVSFRKELGEKAYRFAHTKWAVKNVANNVLRVIDGNIPAEWYVDPLQIGYPYGFGISREGLTKNIQSVIERGGERALCMEENVKLKQKYIDINKLCNSQGYVTDRNQI